MFVRFILFWLLISRGIPIKAPPITRDTIGNATNTTSFVPTEETQNNDLVCPLASCTEDRSVHPCACDDLCTAYGDCCPEYRLPHLTKLPHPFIRCSDVFWMHFLLVSRCPGSWSDIYVKDMCERSWPGILNEYLIPVTANNSRFSYKNMFCAFCHGHHLDELKYWEYSIQCRGAGIQNKTLNIEAAVPLIRIGKCKVNIGEPFRRPCLPGALIGEEMNVLTSETGLNIKMMKCLTFTEYVVLRLGDYNKIYKNKHCAECSGIDMNKLKCAIFIPARHSLSTLKLSALFSVHKPRVHINSLRIERKVQCLRRNDIFVRDMCRANMCYNSLNYKYDVIRKVCYQTGDPISHEISKCGSRKWNGALKHATRQYVRHRARLCLRGEMEEVAILDSLEDPTYMYDVIRDTLREIGMVRFRKMALLSNWRVYHPITHYTTKCTTMSSKGLLPDVYNSTFRTILSLIGTKKWPWAVNITFVNIARGANMSVRSSVKICSLKDEVCPAVRIPQPMLEYPELKPFIWHRKTLGGKKEMAMCLEPFLEIQDEQREFRQRNLARVIGAEIRRLKEKRRSQSGGPRLFESKITMSLLLSIFFNLS